MNKRIYKLFAVLAVLLLLLSALPVTAFAANGGSATVTAKVATVRNVTARRSGAGNIIVLAPERVHDGDTVEFTVTPDRGNKISAVYCNNIDVTNKLDDNKFTVTVSGDIAFYAVFVQEETPLSSIGGKVMQKAFPNNTVVPNASVELFLGDLNFSETLTDDNGNYSFGSIEKGIYNIVVTKPDNSVTHTELVTVNESRKFSVDILLPAGDVSSMVEHEGEEAVGAKSRINETVVGGLDKIAALEEPEGGNSIKIKLKVEPKAEAETKEQEAIAALAGEGTKVEFLDLTLTRQINNEEPEDIGDKNNQLLTIVIPFDFTGVNVSSVTVLRNHGDAEKLKKNPSAGEEGFTVNVSEGNITIIAKLFSPYAISYIEGSDEPKPKPWKKHSTTVTIGEDPDKTEGTNPETGAPVLNMSTGITVIAAAAFIFTDKKHK